MAQKRMLRQHLVLVDSFLGMKRFCWAHVAMMVEERQLREELFCQIDIAGMQISSLSLSNNCVAQTNSQLTFANPI
tara:strand:+ start:201 stop:428 length:228 start_codon:yes stop_codon:yes gene_type:complete